MPPSENLSWLDSLKNEHRRKFYEAHKGVATVMILVVFFAPFAGLAIHGPSTAALGVVLSIAGYYMAPYLVHLLKR